MHTILIAATERDFHFRRVAEPIHLQQGDALVFMDDESYEQLELDKEFVGERAAFLQDGMKVTVELHEERPIGISLPDQVTLEIIETEPVVKGQTAASSNKPAMCANGVRVMVPPPQGAEQSPHLSMDQV